MEKNWERRTERGDAATAVIRATSPGASLEVMALDPADLAGVHRFAADGLVPNV